MQIALLFILGNPFLLMDSWAQTGNRDFEVINTNSPPNTNSAPRSTARPSTSRPTTTPANAASVARPTAQTPPPARPAASTTPQKYIIVPTPPPTYRPPARREEAVDLNALNMPTPRAAAPNPATAASPAGAGGTSTAYGSGAGAPPTGVAPNFRFYFDFWLINRPGVTDLSFQNVHSITMIEIAPRPDVLFNFELRPDPRFYELDFRVNPRFRIRLGKIWVPFDDMNPHNNLGGRVNTTILISGSTLFLPNIWTDLGVAGEYKLIANSSVDLTAVGYVINGFQAGGSDPQSGSVYPSFNDIANLSFASKDNNRDKGLGGRLQLNLGTKVQLGASGFTCRYSDEGSKPYGISMLGLDARFRFGRIELRGGLITGGFDVPNAANTALTDHVNRGGAYAESWYRWGRTEQYRFVIRGGLLQPDSRVVTINDQMAGSVGLFYRPDFIQYSLEYSQEFNNQVVRPNTSITWARVAISL